MPYICLYIP